jgi:hypothetical protein
MRLNFSCFPIWDLSGRICLVDEKKRGAICKFIQKRGAQMCLNFSWGNHMASTKITGSFIEIYHEEYTMKPQLFSRKGLLN